jgi:hypothetical protein
VVTACRGVKLRDKQCFRAKLSLMVADKILYLNKRLTLSDKNIGELITISLVKKLFEEVFVLLGLCFLVFFRCFLFP